MPRHLIEREFPDGRAIPQNNVSANLRRTVVDNKTGAGATLQACVRLALLFGAIPTAYGVSPLSLTVNDSGDAGDGTCTSVCTLRDAIANIASGGTIDFAPVLLPSTITLTQGALAIDKSLQIQGPGAAQLAISADNSSRLLYVPQYSAASISISGVTLRDGAVIGADGTNGTSGVGGSNADGADGPSVGGGCIYSSYKSYSSLLLDRVDIRNCVAQGGKGGDGGSGTAGSGLAAGGRGGLGGRGGSATGGGIAFYGYTLVLQNSNVVNARAVGGAGGTGGDGGSGFFHGPGGAAGHGGGALGGAVLLEGNGLLDNVTIATSTAVGGNGGGGGSGDSTLTTASGGNGGNGGDALGGLVSVAGTGFVDLEFATLTNGTLTPGAGGDGGAGAKMGDPGMSGSSDGTAIFAESTNYTLSLSTIIVGNGPASLCSAGIQAFPGSANLAQDNSCLGFNFHGNFAQLFRPLDPGAASPAFMPTYGSVVIDAATSCNDMGSQPVTADQNGTPRPQGSACDLGAIEADYIFVDGFE